MFKAHTILLTLISMVLLPGATVDPADVAIEAGQASQQQMAEWAIDRFAQAGLDLPPLVIRFLGPDLADCGGARGRTYLDQDPIEIRMCWNSELILLHELAHAWEAHNVVAADHETFMALRDGVSSWASTDVAWVERGREHSANVIAWGLLEDPYPISGTYPNDPDSLLEAFRFLTNSEPLHDGGSPIQSPDRSLYEGRSNPSLESGR
jgi:hypothetical protein